MKQISTDLTRHLEKLPETGMGYQQVLLHMKNGAIAVCTIFNCEQYDETEVAGDINFDEVEHVTLLAKQ